MVPVVVAICGLFVDDAEEVVMECSFAGFLEWSFEVFREAAFVRRVPPF